MQVSTKNPIMKYREIRRRDRVLEEQRAREILENGEYGFLSLQNCNGGGYGIPLSYAVEDENIYFHCAPEGHKLECLEKEKRVTFCVVGHTRILPVQFTTAYESVLVFGSAWTGLSDEERAKALWLLVGKYSPEYREIAARYIKNSFHRTRIIRLHIERITAKCKIIG